MGWDLMAVVNVDGDERTLESWNYTHNCNPMIRGAGFSEWPYEVDGMDGKELSRKLDAALRSLRAEPERFRAMNPSNGWGSYDSLVPVLEEVADFAATHPSVTWRMWA